MILSAQTIKRLNSAGTLIIRPFVDPPEQAEGMSFGLGPAGYDLRIGKIERNGVFVEGTRLSKGEFLLVSALEWMSIPDDILARCTDKSTLARKGLAVQNTVLEPGWFGHLTLELTNHGPESIALHVGMPIAQIIFEQIDQPTDRPYRGKYQGQEDRPVPAITDWNPE